MALVTDKIIFLHIPKCAGTFIRHAFKYLKLQYHEIGEQHTHFPELLEYNPESYYDNKFIFTFIRHPLTWYQSRWAFRMKNGWKLQHPLDRVCASNNFMSFIEASLEHFPDGWVTHEYNNYINTIPRGAITFIGRTEFLLNDLVYVLNTSGQCNITKEQLSAMPIINDSNLDGRPSHYWAKYTKILADRVLHAERQIIKCYYNDITINPNVLFVRSDS